MCICNNPFLRWKVWTVVKWDPRIPWVFCLFRIPLSTWASKGYQVKLINGYSVSVLQDSKVLEIGCTMRMYLTLLSNIDILEMVICVLPQDSNFSKRPPSKASEKLSQETDDVSVAPKGETQASQRMVRGAGKSPPTIGREGCVCGSCGQAREVVQEVWAAQQGRCGMAAAL